VQRAANNHTWPGDADLCFVPVTAARDQRPTLFVVVDTEEEFEWDAPFSRENVSVRAIRALERVQRIFDDFHVRPTYVVDYPVASQQDGYLPILEFCRDGRCAVGAHLHPWVNPPYLDELTRRNSYACNLPAALEREKLRRLVEKIEENLGVRVDTYKAGRYGFGRSTVDTLRALGIEVDVSINPEMDYSRDGGPSFMGFSPHPFWFGEWGGVLEIPCTTGYAGYASGVGQLLHAFASRRALEPFRLVSILSRTGAVSKIRLSPEGHSFHELRQLTRALFQRGLRTFAFTFHSSSVEPGHTPYVQTLRDWEHFTACIRQYLEFFFGELAGVSSTPAQYRTQLAQRASTNAPGGHP
jgi:hypothetical protein